MRAKGQRYKIWGGPDPIGSFTAKFSKQMGDAVKALRKLGQSHRAAVQNENLGATNQLGLGLYAGSAKGGRLKRVENYDLQASDRTMNSTEWTLFQKEIEKVVGAVASAVRGLQWCLLMLSLASAVTSCTSQIAWSQLPTNQVHIRLETEALSERSRNVVKAVLCTEAAVLHLKAGDLEQAFAAGTKASKLFGGYPDRQSGPQLDDSGGAFLMAELAWQDGERVKAVAIQAAVLGDLANAHRSYIGLRQVSVNWFGSRDRKLPACGRVSLP